MDSFLAHSLIRITKNKKDKRGDVFEGEPKRPPEGGYSRELGDTEFSNFRSGEYVPPNDLSKMSLKRRQHHVTSMQDIARKRMPPSLLPESRNIGQSIWRRYLNGTLDFYQSLPQLVEAVRKYNENEYLNEVDALTITSVYPEVKFDGLDKFVVDRKAYLDVMERDLLRKLMEENEEITKLRIIADIGGA